MKLLFEEFEAEEAVPILVSYVNHLKGLGYTCEVDFGFWDVFAYKGEDGPEVAVLQVKNSLRKDQLYRLSRESYKFKVVLAESSDVNAFIMPSLTTFLAMLGVGMYVRDAGWVVLPNENKISAVKDLEFRTAKRWYRTKEGEWRKNCSKCGKSKAPDEFYPRNYPKARDPYRHICKECFKERYKAT